MTATRLAKNRLGATGLEITRGVRRPDQVDSFLPAVTVELTDEDAAELEGDER
jgi:hypothetical protein